MSKVGAAIAVTFGSTLLFSACSSSEKSITTLPADKTLAALSPEERQQYCQDRFHYLSTRVSADDRTKPDCSAAAAGVGKNGGTDTAKARAACQQVYTACMGTLSPQPQVSCDSFPKDAQSCTATVGEVDDCAAAQADALEKLASSAEGTCDALASTTPRKADRTTPTMPSPAPSPSTAPCDRVQRLCPKLFDEPALGTTGTTP